MLFWSDCGPFLITTACSLEQKLRASFSQGAFLSPPPLIFYLCTSQNSSFNSLHSSHLSRLPHPPTHFSFVPCYAVYPFISPILILCNISSVINCCSRIYPYFEIYLVVAHTPSLFYSHNHPVRVVRLREVDS